METRDRTPKPRRKATALVAFSILQLSAGFSVLPSSRRGSSIPFRTAAPDDARRGGQHHQFAPRPLPSNSLALHALVADEKEELHKRKEEDDSSSNAWIETPDGGFLPNFLGTTAPNGKISTGKNSNGGVKWLSVSPSISIPQQTHPLITEVKSLQQYKAVVADEKDAIVVVRFYASWCRACRAVAAPYRQLAQKYHRGHHNVKFVEVPLTPDNAVLHQGLGVPSLPYGHIYHPDAGLVEERSLNKKRFGDFVQILQTYVDGECPIEWDARDDSADEGR